MARTQKQRHIVLKMLEKWIDGQNLAARNRLIYDAVVRDFFNYNSAPLPLNPAWALTYSAVNRFNPVKFRRMLDECQKDPRARSMLLVQLQGFVGVRELCLVGNTMGLKIANELKQGANIVRLDFSHRRRRSTNPWYTFIGREACDGLRDWFTVRGWPDTKNPYVWPGRRRQKPPSSPAPLTVNEVSRNFSRLARRLRLQATARMVRNLGLSIAMRASLRLPRSRRVPQAVISFFAGHRVQLPSSMSPLKVKSLEAQYRLLEPYLSPSTSKYFQ